MLFAADLSPLAGAAAIWFALVVLAAFVMIVFAPIMAWSLVHNVKLIRKNLEQLNDTLALPSRRI